MIWKRSVTSLENSLEAKGTVVSIQRASLHDGEGLRTTVFLKGCNMHCYWCHNPESISPEIQISYDRSLCIGCNECVKACPENVCINKQGYIEIDAEKCQGCAQCVESCFPGALKKVGRKMNVSEVMDEIELDEAFYRLSGGGVTISGGEPLMQAEFTSHILMECKKRGLYTALETNASAQWKTVQKVIENVDLIFADIKTMNDDLHRKATGISNARLLQNIKKISQAGKRIIIRTPVVPGFNADKQSISQICDFLSKLNIEYYELLSYHPLGQSKGLNLIDSIKPVKIGVPQKSLINELAQIACGYGLDVRVDSKRYKCQGYKNG